MDDFMRTASGFLTNVGKLLKPVPNRSPDERGGQRKSSGKSVGFETLARAQSAAQTNPRNEKVDRGQGFARAKSTAQANLSFEGSMDSTIDGAPAGRSGRSWSWVQGNAGTIDSADTVDDDWKPGPSASGEVRVFGVLQQRKKSQSYEPGDLWPGEGLFKRVPSSSKGKSKKGKDKEVVGQLYTAQVEAEKHRQSFEKAAEELVRRQKEGVCGRELRKLQDRVDEELWLWCRRDKEAMRLSKSEWMQMVEARMQASSSEDDDEDAIEKFLRAQGASTAVI